MVHINNNVETVVSGGYQPHYPPPPPQNSAFPVNGDPPAAVHVHVNQSYTQQPGYEVVEVMHVKGDPPLACGIGYGWVLFILGFFFTIPWYVGAIIFMCSKIDRRERPGCIACTVGAVFITILIIVVVVAQH